MWAKVANTAAKFAPSDASVGVATAICRPGLDPAEWIKAADAELYKAKAAGRNCVMGQFFDEQAMRETWKVALSA